MATQIMKKVWSEDETHWNAEEGLRPKDQLISEVAALAAIYSVIAAAVITALPS